MPEEFPGAPLSLPQKPRTPAQIARDHQRAGIAAQALEHRLKKRRRRHGLHVLRSYKNEPGVAEEPSIVGEPNLVGEPKLPGEPHQ